MKNTLLLFTALSLFLAGCDPEPTPEPEEKTLVGHTYITVYVDHLTVQIYRWGYTFISDDKVVVISYKDNEIISTGDTLKYTLHHPILEFETEVQYIVSDDYSQFERTGGPYKPIYTRVQ